MRTDRHWRTRKGERGQTIVLVAISILSLLAMAALAIDVVSVYVARAELQRAADAAALVAAKAVVDSGVTSYPVASAPAALRTLASQLAQQEAQAIIQQNLVAGVAPLLAGVPTIDYSSHQGNPIITVELQRANLPTFFARIWGRGSTTVTATASAEAYNPANIAGSTGYTPITLTNVKPWLVANACPIPAHCTSPQFVLPSGAVTYSIIGYTFDLTSDCQSPNCATLSPDAMPTDHPSATQTPVDFIPAVVTANTSDVCPSSCSPTGNYDEKIECADANAYAYLNCGQPSGGTAQISWDTTVNPNVPPNLTADATECLIQASGTGPAPPGSQDSLDTTGWVNSDLPMKITSSSSVLPVTTSRSIVTIPIIDNSGLPPLTNPVTIVGYLQAFINGVEPGFGGNSNDINITVMNIVGCANNNVSANTPVIGATGSTTIPIRLITKP